MVHNKTGTTITEQSKTKIEEEVKDITVAEVVITIKEEVIPIRIRTWINNIILINKEETACKSQVVKWIWVACLNHLCKTLQVINSKWICSSSSQEYHNKCNWISRWSFYHRLISVHLNPWKDSKSLSLSVIVFTDLFKMPWEKNLLLESLVCSLMRTQELISNSFWQITSISLAKSTKLTNSFYPPKDNEFPLLHLQCVIDLWNSKKV